MELRAFYESWGADYDELLRRLGGREDLLRKYLAAFTRDESFRLLEAAVMRRDYPEALRAAHALKGICLNLELTPLAIPCAELVAAIRADRLEPVDALFQQAANSFHQILERLAL